MPSDLSGVLFFLWLLVAGLFSYGAYWAFTIRRALVHPLYKRQASWVGRMGLYFVVLSSFLDIALSYNVNGLPVNILGGAIIGSGFIVIFAWIDSTIRVARRSDPLSRDTLRWSHLRIFLGIATVGGSIGAMVTAITVGISQTPPFGGVLFFGAVALLISARRSGDPTLRKHLVWTGLCTFLLWFSSQLEMPLSRLPVLAESRLSEIITFAFVALGAYALYRSAKSLIPLGHVTLGEAASMSQSPVSLSISSAVSFPRPLLLQLGRRLGLGKSSRPCKN